ncbi:uncharacterized protein LOC141696764 [Apium graveolens]|uniref:uncharacterized protein LOC141696764 n=1 Tax=Apium graveolens TaxID=4045 RepID=UPI003D7B3245
MVSKRGIKANPDKIKAILDMEPPRSIKDVQKLTGRIAALGRFISKSGEKCLPFFKTLKKVKDFKWTVEIQEAFEQLKKYMTEAPLLAKPSSKDTLYLYLAISEQAVSVVLVKEEQNLQKPVYYISKLDFLTTNNEAEYETLIAGLGLARAMRDKKPEDEALKEVQERICGQHLGGRALAYKITRLGFYWPTMLDDAKAYMKRCDRCQRHAPIVRQPPERLTSIKTPIPFAIWGMDILGPFPLASGQRKFIVENGQAEVANRIILDGLKKMVKHSRNTWVDELLPILWAYRTTCKVTTEATPFMLAYGAEAVVPLEITHGSPRIESYELETNEEGMRLALDPIDEVRDEASARNAKHQ